MHHPAGDNPITDQHKEQRPTPRVWLLMGHKAGDNAQIMALAEALDWPYEVKAMVYRPYELGTNLLLGDSLAGLVKKRSSPLTPPWPDLVITAGRRNEPVARWIKSQGGNQIRIVHFGRPWAALRHFDLIITTPQYQLPAGPNVLHNTLPLHTITSDKLTNATQQWAGKFAHLPRPYIAVLVGGHSGSYTFSTDKARYLAEQAAAIARARGGSLLVTTSARTPATITAAMQAAIIVPNYFFTWTRNAAENPYYGLLALADSFIVTGDSISMLTEACATRKPVRIFDIAKDHGNRKGLKQWFAIRPTAFVNRLATTLAPRRMVRDVSVIHQQLLAAGRAVWLGQPFDNESAIPALEDLQRATVRVRALFI